MVIIDAKIYTIFARQGSLAVSIDMYVVCCERLRYYRLNSARYDAGWVGMMKRLKYLKYLQRLTSVTCNYVHVIVHRYIR